MIFEVFVGFLAIIIVFIILGLGFHNWYFTLTAGAVTLIFTLLLFTAGGLEYNDGQTIYTNYTADANDVINSSVEQITFNYSEVEGFNIAIFSILMLLSSIAITFMALGQKKEID